MQKETIGYNLSQAGLKLHIGKLRTINIRKHSVLMFQHFIKSSAGSKYRMISVSFQAPKHFLQIDNRLSPIQALIHVSTAYSNADKEEIGETVYPIPENVTSDMYPNDVLPAELLKKVGEKMEKNHPNTYTATKAMAEWVVAEYADNIPAAIVRPSIGR